MKTLARMISHILIASMVLMPFSSQAGMVGTEQVVAAAAAQSARDKVRDFVDRADVQKQLVAFGLTAANARDRVDAMTDEEVQRIAGKVDSLPAGASNTGTAWIAAGVILVAVIVYLLWK